MNCFNSIAGIKVDEARKSLAGAKAADVVATMATAEGASVMAPMWGVRVEKRATADGGGPNTI